VKFSKLLQNSNPSREKKRRSKRNIGIPLYHSTSFPGLGDLSLPSLGGGACEGKALGISYH